MKNKILFFIISIFFLLGITTSTKAEETVVNDKHQLRAVWIATVYNLDMPKHVSETQYKSEFIKILDKIQEYNFNAIVFQIRPANDAFYSSQLNPWSKYLTGVQGRNPGWDPLAWMIEECHKRGIEFHAWLNPYRVTPEKVGATESKEQFLNLLDDLNFAKKNKDSVLLATDGQPILNPGDPKVKKFIVDTIDEIITNYDVDAIHFDDYFYPYGGVKDNSDTVLYDKYKENGQTLADWRRSNVDEVIQKISILIKKHNVENSKNVQFGISPFGIWMNKGTTGMSVYGSDTRGNQSYVTQHADTRKWVKEEWIDYIAPQLYWNIGLSVADYEVLVKWWADVVKGTNVNLYIGHGIHNYKDGSTAWGNYNEVLLQLSMNKSYPEVKGSIMYAYNHLNRMDSQALIKFRGALKNNEWNTVALAPVLNMQNNPTPSKVNLTTEAISSSSISLSWDKVEGSKYYVVYRAKDGDTIDLSKRASIYKIVGNDSSKEDVTFTDSNVSENSEYTYYVSVLYGNGFEGEVANVTLKATNPVDPDPVDPDPVDPDPTDKEPSNPEPTPSPKNNTGKIIAISTTVLVIISGLGVVILKKQKL